jgi:Ca2+:H+ antiporter
VLLLALPAAVAFKYFYHQPVWLFVASCVAIIPLAGLMGRATENLAETMGAGIGGLLNATFGNAAELIIALMALHAKKFDVVKASLTGSIIGNILLVLGAAIAAGGTLYRRQVFNRTAASMGATLLALAAAGLLLPTFHYYIVKSDLGKVELLSEEIAGILLLTYVLSLLFSLRTHRHLFAGPEESLPTTGEHGQPEWSRGTSLVVLAVATAGVAWMSEFLVSSVEAASLQLGMNEVFVGVIVVAVIGNAAEHSTAILVALKDKMDLAVNIAVGSSIQIALFVAPVLVFASLLMGHPPEHRLDLHFSALEVVAVILSVGVLSLVAQDGETHWMEGVMLLAVYVMLALAFYHLPNKP